MREPLRPDLLARQERRAANEQVALALIGGGTDVMTVLCECGHQACDAEMTLQRTAYRKIRLKGSLFVVRSGHEHSARIVARNGPFAIVEGT